MTADVVPITRASDEHITVVGSDGNVYVTPLALYREIAGGDRRIDTLEGYEYIVPSIIHDWLVGVVGIVGIEDGDED